jgi:hypothetical protein
MRIPLARWVAPFGDPGINDRSHLPRAFRSVPRPSSPLSAKASTRCPYLRLSATPNGKDPCQISEVRYQRSEPIGATNFSFSEDTTGQRDAQPFRGRTAVSRYGHTTRFFTIFHQQRPRRPKTGDAGQGKFQVFLPRSSLAAGGLAAGGRRLSRFASQTTVGAPRLEAAHDVCRCKHRWWR